MLKENDVVDHLIQSLEVNGYSIKQALYDRQQGIDVIAEKQRATLYIEVKGETSGDETSSRYGKPFHSGQVFDMVSKVIFKALDNTKKLLDQLNISGELFKDNIQRFYDFEV